MQKENQQPILGLTLLKKSRYWRTAIFILGISLLLVLVSFYFYMSKNRATVSKITKIETKAELTPSLGAIKKEISVVEGVPCTGNIIIDDSAGYSIICPANLKLYTYRNESVNNNQFEKMIYFCESQINSFDPIPARDRCPGGIFIWVNGDGWGGGYCEENRSTINLDGKAKTYCLFNDGFGGLYAGDLYQEYGGNCFLFEGLFSDTFTKQDALQMLSTFKIL